MRIRRNEEFVKWWNRWSARIRRSRVPPNQDPPKNTAAAETRENITEQNRQRPALKPYGFHNLTEK